MKILGVESSATSASAAVSVDGKLVSLQYQNTGLTHSRTLMSLVDKALNNADVTLKDIDFLAVSNGPGSFTGIRIGVATVKGLAFTDDIKCIPVSTLEVIAAPMSACGSFVVSVMDARCNQFYTASFSADESGLKRLTEDRAISGDELKEDLLQYKDKNIILIGDGTDVAFDKLKDDVPNLYKADSSVKYQSASSLVSLAYKKICASEENAVPCEDVVPQYLRLSQAERELKLKKNK